MADLISRSAEVKDLQSRAARLTETAQSLISLLAEESNRLNRKDEASRLEVLRSSIAQQLGQAKRSEDAAEYGHVSANMISALGGIALKGIIKQVSKNKRLSEFADHAFESHVDKEPPFGTVLICIGSKGLPDDVRTVSVSRSARESNLDETEVINALRENGYLLLAEKAFYLLIKKLINDVQDGRRRLPVSLKELSEIIASGFSGLELDHSV